MVCASFVTVSEEVLDSPLDKRNNLKTAVVCRFPRHPAWNSILLLDNFQDVFDYENNWKWRRPLG